MSDISDEDLQFFVDNIEQLRNDPNFFAKHILKLDLHKGQQRILACQDRFIAVRAGRRFGKSFVFSVFATWMASVNKNCRIVCISKSLRQANELFQKIYIMVSNSILSEYLVRNTQSLMKFSNGSIIESLPGKSPDSLRGPTINLILADEAAYIPDQLFDAIYPTILNVKGKSLGKMCLISTPRFKSGTFYKAFQEGSRYTKFHMSYDDAIYEDGTRQMPEEELEFEAQRCGGRETTYFQREYCAEFGNSEENFFDDIGVEQSLTENLPQIKYAIPGRTYVIGADLGLNKDYSVFTTMDCTKKDNLEIVNIERFHGESPDQIMHKLYQKTLAFNARTILIDDGKIGASIVSHLQLNYPKYNWKPFNFNTTSKVPLLADLNIAMCTGILKIPDIDIVREELLSFYYEENLNTKHLKLSGIGSHDDIIISLGLVIRAGNVFSKRGGYNIVSDRSTNIQDDDNDASNSPQIRRSTAKSLTF